MNVKTKELAIAPGLVILEENSKYWEACARHVTRQTSRAMQSLYLCDDCLAILIKEALNGRSPIYHGETVTGFCGLCNENKTCRMRMFFMCGFCWNVVIAYQKSRVASKAVRTYWNKYIEPTFPNLMLTETEEVYLSPYIRKGKTKKQAASDLQDLDFIVSSKRNNRALFHIELKSGPGSVESMTEFQLDINDSNDIIGVVLNTALPAYIFHVQLAHRYALPTRCTVAVDMWWTDIFTLLNNRKVVRNRFGEEKDAGYYLPTAFKPIKTFVAELKSKNYKALTSRVLKGELSIE